MVMPFFSFGIGPTYYTGNMYQDYKLKYGYGPSDFNEHPRVAGYPAETSPRPNAPVRDTFLRRVIVEKFK